MKAFVTGVLIAGIAAWAPAEETPRKSRFLTPAELAELGDKSKVKYATTIVKSEAELPAFRHPGLPKDGPLAGTPYPEISRGKDGSRALNFYRIPDGARKALQDAEPLFQDKQYAKALAIYREASDRDPDCYLLHLNIGDCRLFSGDAAGALASYDKAIQLNPDDFHGPWFRASALLDLGRPDEARASYARALAMSPRNATLLKAINANAARLGIRAREEMFHPKATAAPEGDQFVIYTVDVRHWWLYGLCKAVWLAEEGHRKDLTGSADHPWTNTEELECLANLLAEYRTDRDAKMSAPEPELDLLLSVLESGDLPRFVDYEFGSRVTSDYAILLDDETRAGLTRFVEQYVFEKP